jgi:hypothetical protein
MKTLLLDVETWDLCVDASGNVAIAAEPYALAQDVASEQRTYVGDCYYDQTRGVFYFPDVMGQRPNLSPLRAQYEAAALLVPGVAQAVTYFTGLTGRRLTGQTQITDGQGETQRVGF